MNHPSMKTLSLAVTLAGGALFTNLASAADLCDVAEAERQPIEALQAQLESQGWEVKNIKIDDGCYEAYAIDETGERVEAYFDPKSFDLVKTM